MDFNELKLDGVRHHREKEGFERLASLSRRARRDPTATPSRSRHPRVSPPNHVVLDGEIVAFDETGHPNFAAPRIRRMHLESRAREVRRAMTERPSSTWSSSCLPWGTRPSETPLGDEKSSSQLYPPAQASFEPSTTWKTMAAQLLEFCRIRDLEGIVARRARLALPRRPPRHRRWVKMKCERDDEFVIVGFTAAASATWWARSIPLRTRAKNSCTGAR